MKINTDLENYINDFIFTIKFTSFDSGGKDKTRKLNKKEMGSLKTNLKKVPKEYENEPFKFVFESYGGIHHFGSELKIIFYDIIDKQEVKIGNYFLLNYSYKDCEI